MGKTTQQLKRLITAVEASGQGVLTSVAATAAAITTLTVTTITATAGGDLTLLGIASHDIIVKLIGTTSARKISFTNTSDSEVAKLDAAGLFTPTSLATAAAAITTATVTTLIATATTALAITARAGYDINVTLGADTTGNKISFKNASASEVASIGGTGIGTFAGIVSALGTMTTITATAASDLTLVGVATKDIIMKLGEAVGARKFIVKDSANAEVFSVNSDGRVLVATGAAGGIQINYATAALTGTAPTNTQCVTAFGAVTGNEGNIGIYRDSTSTYKCYICMCDGVQYYIHEMTKAA